MSSLFAPIVYWFTYRPVSASRVAGPLSVPTAVYAATPTARIYAYRYTLVYTYLTATLPYPTATEHLAPLHLVERSKYAKGK